MIYEVRDYHYRADLMDAYTEWARGAVAVLRNHLDVVGFWVDRGAHGPRLSGSNPQVTANGHATVTWIIRWDSVEQRDEVYPKAFTGDDWTALMAKHPDRNGYLQQTVRFMEAL